MQDMEVYDVTIIGGGPAGLFSAFYSGLREMKTKLIEFQPFLGGKVHVYPEKMIWDIGGLTPVPGSQLIDQIVAQGLTFEPKVVLGEKVTSLSQDERGHFVLHTASNQKHYSKTVILAVGGGILKPIKLDIEGAERFEVQNLHYTVKSLARFKDKTVLISGGGNSAIDWANELEPIAKQVYLTYRKEALKGHEAQISHLKNSSVQFLLHTSIEKLIAADDHERIKTVVLKNNQDDALFDLAIDEVIINHGYERDKELLANSTIKLEQKDYWIAGTPLSETSVRGIYAAGDILHHEGKLHLIAGAFQDAANAVNQAKQYVMPDASARGMVSSHNDIFIQKNKELMKHLYTK
ncbi:NAD(P)/FAD-dependent oxidoreductase [Bacillus sp. FSL K6-4563]|uniref:NAD(P)/FAD-dependent oxidoreductase n=1 Tax=Bacillus TaxID=1386 RepID=UPI00017A5D53|nr:NAD(P)/FAD-dependent oxidoreductase [Bacillus pumilus]EDW22401.1 FAD-dependent pyridine nucleotide-disulphide oxidoreductase [Bacillus pumilus ATCC 7061]MCR4352448.1 NAD(P)/FAD-dependent oxidoreductase [Bacillus pumilus]MCY7502263.1 NAD(P)/FAD-dependent oxidoreductase [Bacillus pumilus]MCY7504258.1 NAD(P)/FAD-dependent oxidoreductase [Bacillus pumilus]MCY7527207.1 NAD(P)/FAD-dependent oxidoreductase [Bacillus pumilus]